MADNTAPNFLLSYSIPAAKRAEFLDFVSNGKRNADGEPEVDDRGNQMTGVIAWLRDNGLHNTGIYTLENSDGSLMFFATSNSRLPDWAHIAGFQERFGPNTRIEKHPDFTLALTISRR